MFGKTGGARVIRFGLTGKLNAIAARAIELLFDVETWGDKRVVGGPWV